MRKEGKKEKGKDRRRIAVTHSTVSMLQERKVTFSTRSIWFPSRSLQEPQTGRGRQNNRLIIQVREGKILDTVETTI